MNTHKFEDIPFLHARLLSVSNEQLVQEWKQDPSQAHHDLLTWAILKDKPTGRRMAIAAYLANLDGLDACVVRRVAAKANPTADDWSELGLMLETFSTAHSDFADNQSNRNDEDLQAADIEEPAPDAELVAKIQSKVDESHGGDINRVSSVAKFAKSIQHNKNDVRIALLHMGREPRRKRNKRPST